MRVVINDYDIELENQEETERLFIEADVSVTRDSYGEDIDGNRGVPTLEIEINSIQIYNEKDKDITELVEDKYELDYAKIIEQIQEKAAEQY